MNQRMTDSVLAPARGIHGRLHHLAETRDLLGAGSGTHKSLMSNCHRVFKSLSSAGPCSSLDKTSAPGLRSLMKKEGPEWMPDLSASALAAFHSIKQVFTEGMTLAACGPAKPTQLFTNAPTRAYGGTFEQAGQPLTCFSGSFGTTNADGQSLSEKSLLSSPRRGGSHISCDVVRE